MDSTPSRELTISINPKRILGFLILIIVCLTLAHLAAQIMEFHFGVNNWLVKVFNLDAESSIPTLCVVIEFMCCIVLLGIITTGKKKQRGQYLYWLGITLVFAFLAIDEVICFHETISTPLRRALKTSGPFFYAWTIPYLVVLLFLGGIYLRFLLRLPARTRNLFICAAALFLTGAVVLEFFEGSYVPVHGRDAFFNLFFITLEEALEMTGLAVFIYALSSYIAEEFNTLQLRFLPSNTKSPEE